VKTSDFVAFLSNLCVNAVLTGANLNHSLLFCSNLQKKKIKNMKKYLAIIGISLFSYSCVSTGYHREPKGPRYPYERDGRYEVEREHRGPKKPHPTKRHHPGKMHYSSNQIKQQYKRIEVMERKAWRDGRLSAQERRSIAREKETLDYMLRRR
jgi:hypothetical protein